MGKENIAPELRYLDLEAKIIDLNEYKKIEVALESSDNENGLVDIRLDGKSIFVKNDLPFHKELYPLVNQVINYLYARNFLN